LRFSIELEPLFLVVKREEEEKRTRLRNRSEKGVDVLQRVEPR